MELIGPFFKNVQLLVHAVEVALEADGSFVAMNNRVSQSVPHLHVHVVPRRRKDGLKGFFWPRNKYVDQAEMLGVQKMIQTAIARIKTIVKNRKRISDEKSSAGLKEFNNYAASFL